MMSRVTEIFCPDPFSRLPELLENMKLDIFSEFQEPMIEFFLESLRHVKKLIQCRVVE